MIEIDLKKNDEFFQTNFQEITNELCKLLKYVIKMEKSPEYILPKIENSLENLNKIMSEARITLIEIQDKKQQVIDFLQNSQDYRESLQTFEALKQAYKQKFKDQEFKIEQLEKENIDLKNELKKNSLAFIENKTVLEQLEINLDQKIEYIEKIESEKDSLKNQINNFTSLIKQINLEKQIGGNNQSNHKEIEIMIGNLRGELLKTKEEYSKRIRIKDVTIEQFQRKIDLLEKETALNEDLKFMKENFPEKKEKKSKNNTKIKQNY